MEDPKSKKTRRDSPGDAGRGVGVPAKGDSSASNPSIGGLLRGRRYLLHDRDTKFCASFRELIESGSLETIRLPARSPNLNSFAERRVRSVTSSESLTSPYGNQPIPGTTATVSTRKTSGESDLGAALQCGSRIETAREPTTQSLLLSVPAMVPMSCLHFIRCSFGGVGD